MTQWHTQSGNVTTSLKVKIFFTLPEFSATKIVIWNCHMDYLTKDLFQLNMTTFICAFSF